jgi:hypothetical protein
MSSLYAQIASASQWLRPGDLLKAICGLVLFPLISPLTAAEPPLQFIEPKDGQLFIAPASVPIVVRGYSPDTVFANAELFANQTRIATLTFCCYLCPCAFPIPGIATTLQIPVVGNEFPPPRSWQDWTNVPAGTYRLVAKSMGQSGVMVETPPITVEVIPSGLDLRLRVNLSADGSMQFVIPDGSLVPGQFVLEASDNFLTWNHVADFSPGNMFAIAEVQPGATVPKAQFYRARRKP